MYKIIFNEKIAVIDDYQNGEQGQGSSFGFDEQVQADTLKDVLIKACELVGMDSKYFTYDCGMDYEDGAICLNVLEDEEGAQLSNAEIELWKQGKFTAYSCSYFATVYKMETVNLQGVEL